jgi:hypothetical protein
MATTQEQAPALRLGQNEATIGFFGTDPQAQATPAANTHTTAAGSGSPVLVDTKFDGSVGSTAYTVGDLVAILKGLGLLKA